MLTIPARGGKPDCGLVREQMKFRNIQSVNRQISVLESAPDGLSICASFFILTEGWEVPDKDREVSVRLIALLQGGMKRPEMRKRSVCGWPFSKSSTEDLFKRRQTSVPARGASLSKNEP